MYKLDKESVIKFWDEFPDKNISKIVNSISDSQAIEYEVDEESLYALGKALPKLAKLNFIKNKMKTILTILSRLDFKTSLRLIQIFDEISEGSIEVMLDYAQNNSDEKNKFDIITLRSNAFEKLSFYVSLFNKKNMTWLENENSFK
jgi:hypothetical protein